MQRSDFYLSCARVWGEKYSALQDAFIVNIVVLLFKLNTIVKTRKTRFIISRVLFYKFAPRVLLKHHTAFDFT